MNQDVKDKMIAIKKAIMICQVQTKINNTMDQKRTIRKLKILVRKLRCGVTDIDREIQTLTAVIYNKKEETENAK
jgi:hypothetical protein